MMYFLGALFLVLFTIQVQSLDIFEFKDTCNSKPINYTTLLKFENSEISANLSIPSNSCKLILNATGYESCGFLFRINKNITFKSDSFSLNITDHSELPTAAGNNTILFQANSSTLNNVSFIQINSSRCFEISLDGYLNQLDSIVVSAFYYTRNETCGKQKIKCKYPLSTCVDLDGNNIVTTCSDDTFADLKITSKSTSNLSFLPTTNSPSQTTSLLFTTTTTTNSTTLLSTNSTEDFHLIPIQRKSINIIGLFILLLIVISVVMIAIIVYGRRKRRWREFLAQLDNNTDWEYEQLEDLPTANGADRYSTVFDRTISTSENERESQNSNRKHTTTTNNNNEQTPIANSST